MRKNEAGLTILEKGDTVRIGKGKVTYTVFHDENQYGVVDIQSDNTGRVTSEHRNRLYLVQEAPKPEPQEEPVEETSAYAKAVLFALNVKTGKVLSFARGLFYTVDAPANIYAGTVRTNVKAKRRALGRRQKASRKANR